MAAYLIVNFDIDNPDLYRTYQKGARPALSIGTDSTVRVFDSASECLEGEAGHQTVVLEFESKAKARELYESGDYQAVIGDRFNATSKHFAILVDAFAPPA
ncbi:MAG: DUF1330 domain-containing protein [Acidimicrobiales bacterium]